MYVVHVKAICRKSPIHGVTGDMNNFQTPVDLYKSISRFYENIRRRVYCGYRIVTEGVLVTEVSNNAEISI